VGFELDGAQLPRYGAGALADLTPSVLAALGVPGGRNVLDLPESRRVCVLLIDGLGWEQLREHADCAPFLASLPGRELTAGFPATTATSLASLGTGLPPGGHGLMHLQVAVPGTGRLINCLRWDDSVDPEEFQAAPTGYERAAAAGVHVAYVAHGAYRGSGLTRATARGAAYEPADSLGQLVARAEQELGKGDRSFVTVYHPDLDSTGHRHGVGSPAWRYQLSFADQLARHIAEVLPSGAALYITADHGMTNPADRVDADAVEALQEGVAHLGGDARSRYVYAVPGAEADVLAAWRETLGDRAWVRTREEAVAAGWFGAVSPELLPRIGDVVAVARGDLAIVASEREPFLAQMIGMHGSLVPAEMLIPLLTVRRD